jgi:hypothetical protein
MSPGARTLIFASYALAGPLLIGTTRADPIAIASWQRGPIVVEVTHEPDEKLTTYSLGAISSKDKTQPVLVGEEGPELFVPDKPGTVTPLNLKGQLGFGDVGKFPRYEPESEPAPLPPPGVRPPPMQPLSPDYNPDLYSQGQGMKEAVTRLEQRGLIKHNPEAFGAWIDSLPETEHVEDRRPEKFTEKETKAKEKSAKAIEDANRKALKQLGF